MALDPIDEEEDRIRSTWERVVPREEFINRRNELMVVDLRGVGQDPEKREGTMYTWVAFSDLVEKGVLECLETETEISFRLTELGRIQVNKSTE